jgi:hemerythrin superfamily protein
MELLDTIKKTGRVIEEAFMPAADKNGDMDILDKLKLEHNEVKDLLDELVKSESGPARKQYLKKIKAALIPHSRAEEKVVYNAIIMQRDKSSKIDGHEGYFEHGLADKMITKLSKMTNTLSPEFSAAAKVLKELIEHHVDEEERNVWKDVREYFDDAERIEMNRKFEAAKKKVTV